MKATSTRTLSTKPRLSDIAQAAGVSIGTVSRVLNGKSDVATELAERVMAATSNLGYARRPAGPASHPDKRALMVGFLVDAPNLASVTADPFMQHFLAGIEETVNHRGGHLLFATCAEEILAGDIPSMVAENRVQGIIFKSNQHTPDTWIRKLAALVPTVMLMNHCEDRSIHSVMCDNYAATYQTMRYLRNLGHRRIGFLTIEDKGMQNSILHAERLDAYRKYVPILDCEAHTAYIQCPLRDHATETLPHAIEKGLKAFLSLGKKRPTAIICATDIYAFALLHLCPKHGLEVPRDLSVTSFMNTQTCEHSIPPLTSVNLSGDEIGKVAVNLIYELNEKPNTIVRHISVGTRLVERQSCARLPAPAP
ncbi:LacI family transcriptional regulator [Opitutaceae bacterium TAV4]|nr:LacI family transcriptional regulator [Opitutaceae bacterium TAV4]RRK01888.1 LacI family transcriptional regulator [Opitutaceae bacterium TAV3]